MHSACSSILIRVLVKLGTSSDKIHKVGFILLEDIYGVGPIHKMNLLVISYYHSLKDSVGGMRSRAMAKYLPCHGVEVSVLSYCAKGSYFSCNAHQVDAWDITRETVPFAVFLGWRFWQQMLRMLGWHRGVHEYWRGIVMQQSKRIIEIVKPDAILASYPCADTLEIGVDLAEQYDLPLISDFRDGLIFEPVEEMRLRNNATRIYYDALESRVIRQSSMVLTVSEPISEYFRYKYSHKNVITLPNGFDRDDVAAIENIDLPPHIINFVHTGRLGESRMSMSDKCRGVTALCDALNHLNDTNAAVAKKLCFHFVGKLTRQERNIFSPLVDLGIVKLWGHLPRTHALGFQRKADVLLLITEPDKASIATGKIFEYLAANRPILALTRGTEAERIIKKTKSGILAAPDDSLQIAAAIEDFVFQNHAASMVRDEEEISHYTRDYQMAALANFLKNNFHH